MYYPSTLMKYEVCTMYGVLLLSFAVAGRNETHETEMQQTNQIEINQITPNK